ncbi:hypothetical protein LGN13_00135 [Burkholderia multivorans]|jgi:hypothetical protein|uniref:hypothetical protein n=1 Tax=Burkholderia multivorans TaxID=87883 RepID=UPI0020164939|nr:hypothetical protein [Burkholderia multivorans]MCA8500089.1 hypothetical protein [Burkholderia multivorans]MDN8078375.1 hypothetical protein [Burkholderia multivorans]
MKQNPLTSSRRKFLEVAGAAPLLSACGGDDVASAPVTDAALAAQMSAKLNAQLGDAATVDAMLPVTDTYCRRLRPAGKRRRDGGEAQRAAASARVAHFVPRLPGNADTGIGTTSQTTVFNGFFGVSRAPLRVLRGIIDRIRKA